MNKNLKVFSFIWAIVFTILGNTYSINGLYYIAGIFIIVGLFKPSIFILPYKIWIKVGESIGNINAKIILFILYFGLFTPISLFLKIIKKDLLNKKIDKSKSTYWTKRENQPQSMKNQF